MKFLLTLGGAALAFVYQGAVAGNDDLKAELEQKEKELAALTGQIDAESGAEFQVLRDVEVKISTGVIQAWASHISTPNYRASAVATRVEGDLVYQPGFYKVYIQNPSDTNAYIQLSPIAISATPNALSISTSLVGHAETRVFLSVAGATTNIFCDTQPNVTSPVAASFLLQQNGAAGKVDYSLTMTQPSSLNGTVVCHLGGLGNLSMSFPLGDFARELSKGTFDLGYTNQFQFNIPTSPPTQIALPLETRNPSLTIDTKAIDFLADIGIGTK